MLVCFFNFCYFHCIQSCSRIHYERFVPKSYRSVSVTVFVCWALPVKRSDDYMRFFISAVFHIKSKYVCRLILTKFYVFTERKFSDTFVSWISEQKMIFSDLICMYIFMHYWLHNCTHSSYIFLFQIWLWEYCNYNRQLL